MPHFPCLLHARKHPPWIGSRVRRATLTEACRAQGLPPTSLHPDDWNQPTGLCQMLGNTMSANVLLRIMVPLIKAGRPDIPVTNPWTTGRMQEALRLSASSEPRDHIRVDMGEGTADGENGPGQVLEAPGPPTTTPQPGTAPMVPRPRRSANVKTRKPIVGAVRRHAQGAERARPSADGGRRKASSIPDQENNIHVHPSYACGIIAKRAKRHHRTKDGLHIEGCVTITDSTDEEPCHAPERHPTWDSPTGAPLSVEPCRRRASPATEPAAFEPPTEGRSDGAGQDPPAADLQPTAAADQCASPTGAPHHVESCRRRAGLTSGDAVAATETHARVPAPDGDPARARPNDHEFQHGEAPQPQAHEDEVSSSSTEPESVTTKRRVNSDTGAGQMMTDNYANNAKTQDHKNTNTQGYIPHEGTFRGSEPTQPSPDNHRGKDGKKAAVTPSKPAKETTAARQPSA